MNDDEEGIKVKEQAVLELGDLLAKTGQAEGRVHCIQVCHVSLKVDLI